MNHKTATTTTATPKANALREQTDAATTAGTAGRGRNVIPPPEREPLWRGFVRKFEDPLMVVLLVVFMFSLGVSAYEVTSGQRSAAALLEPLGVLTALLLATGVGFVFEVRAESEFRVLAQKKDERDVKVWRRRESDGKAVMMVVARRDVEEGDRVWIESGDEVPADGVLIESQHLLVDESAYTGEPMAEKHVVEGNAAETSESDTAYAPDCLLRSSIVLEGNALMEVTAVGIDTEEGRGAMTLRKETEVETPLARQLSQLSMAITRASYLVAMLIVVGRLVYYFFAYADTLAPVDWMELTGFTLESLLLAVTLVVVAVPEGLPMSVTVSLALSMRKMLRQNNLVRRLHACETMGAATVVCTDKTGTLTQNSMEVAEAEVYGSMEVVARAVAVCSTAALSMGNDGSLTRVGNPTEAAMLAWLRETHGIDYEQLRGLARVEEQELFSSESKQMTTVATMSDDGTRWRFVKGAPEIVMAECKDIAGGVDSRSVEEAMTRMADSGKRTIAVAAQRLSGGQEEGLTLVALIALADPVRPDVEEALRVANAAGVRVIMVTGDVAATALAIARQTGIVSGEVDKSTVMTGAEMEMLTDEVVKKQVLPRLRVLARARPTDKLRLVSLLQEVGEVVAVTGDGTNDALALKRAQVGLSMGSGTARAKEASDITILDNSFATINKAILWGRSLYRNIQRFLLFQMTINITACMIVLIGAMTGLESPLTVTQMLWVNLIMDTFAAMALSSLPPESTVMTEAPRRPEAHIIDRGMARHIVGTGVLFLIVLLALWKYLHKGDQMLTPHELGIFFTTFVFIQFWNLFNARYFRTRRSLIGDLLGKVRAGVTASDHGVTGLGGLTEAFGRGFIAIAITIVVGQVVIVNYASTMFGVEPLTAAEWLIICGLTLPVFAVPDVWRYCLNRWGRKSNKRLDVGK